MSVHSIIDKESLLWVKSEVDATLSHVQQEVKQFDSNEQSEHLQSLVNHLHQVGGVLQILELKSLATLSQEAELLVEDFLRAKTKIAKSSFVNLLNKSLSQLSTSLQRLSEGLTELPIQIVELVNQARTVRGLEFVEISSLFSPFIDIFPEVNASKRLQENEYKKRARSIHRHYQTYLLKWLKEDDKKAINTIGVLIDKLLDMSTFGVVARLWWVSGAYVDYVANHEVQDKSIHFRIFRQINDCLYELEKQGESALVRDPVEELIKVMLFYTGISHNKTDKIKEVSAAFNLHDYFDNDVTQGELGYAEQQAGLDKIGSLSTIKLATLRKLLTHYFESEERPSDQLVEIRQQVRLVLDVAQENKVPLIEKMSGSIIDVLTGLEEGRVERNEDTAFHLASATMFIEQSISGKYQVDDEWVHNGDLKLQALNAINVGQELTDEMDGSHLTNDERTALLAIVSQEVEENLKDIESNLELYSNTPEKHELLSGIDGKIRQIRGALQVLGEHKIGLLLKMAEEQFTALEQGRVEATPMLLESLAIAVGTMEQYVIGLQEGRSNMDFLLERSITDLEVAIGKKVSRDDVETLLEDASDSLFSWLASQSDYDLFTNLKSNLRDLLILSKKTKLINVENLVEEQNRLIDTISQEPAFLTQNITTTLQNNMAGIAQGIIELYGTKATEEELQQDQDLVYKKSAIVQNEDETAIKFFDDMDVDELGEEFSLTEDQDLTLTEIGKQNAVDKAQQPLVDEAILNVFIEESEEILGEANQLHELCQQDVNDHDTIRELRRRFHTMKGSSRMVALMNIGDIAWFGESLFNYVLDTEKPLTRSILLYAREALDEFTIQLKDKYSKQHLIDIDKWSEKTDAVVKDSDLEEDITVAIDDIEQASEQVTDVTDSEPNMGGLVVEQASIQVIDDESMRQVFLQEGSANLTNMVEQIAITDLQIQKGDTLSVVIHTFLGNSRTLRLDLMAQAYDVAEKLCLSKQESNHKVSDEQKQVLSRLVDATRDCLAQLEEYSSDFKLDEERWADITNQLSASLQLEESAQSVSVIGMSVEGVVDLDLDMEDDPSTIEDTEIDFAEIDPEQNTSLPFADLLGDTEDADSITIDSFDTDLVNSVQDDTGDMSRNVEAIFDDIESGDVLFNDEPVADPITSDDISGESSHDDLAEMEDALQFIDGEQQDDNRESLLSVEVADLIGDDELSAQPEVDTSVQTTLDSSAELISADELTQDELDEDLKNIFLEEVRSLYHELDEEVAKLNDLSSAPESLAAIMRHLHTLKGSARMANAMELGDLTHLSESYLEATFIRDNESLKSVRKNLESFVDAVDAAAISYDHNQRFTVNPQLLQSLSPNGEFVQPVNQSPITDIVESHVDDEALEQDDDRLEASESLEHSVVQMDATLKKWKSMAGWKKIKPDMLAQYATLSDVFNETSLLSGLLPLVSFTQCYINDLKLNKAQQFRESKALLEEVYDVIVDDARKLMVGERANNHVVMLAELENTTQSKREPKADETKATSRTDEMPQKTTHTSEQEFIKQQGTKTAKDRAAALRIKAETLDSLTNYVGDSSMNRSQMKEDVLGIKGVVDELYNNVRRFGNQLRELEMEADSKISARNSEPLNKERGDEFDPLELDRYTKLQQLSRGLAENLDELGGIQNSLSGFIHRTETALQKQDRLNRELQDEIMQVRLVSFNGVAPQLRQVVRQTARELSKEVELEIIGSEVRLDKTILDGIVPALEHMLRNAVDHGIETPVQRKKKNKSETGKVTLECRQVAREIIINISDDGAGLDLDKIRTQAIENGLLTEEDTFHPEDALLYISKSGFSTASEVTKISGRGVGMDVVQSILRRMSGNISYDVNNTNTGSNFIIRLPISLAVTSAMFIESGGNEFAVSVRMVERIVNIDVEQLRASLATEKPMLEVDSEQFTLLDLADYLGYESKLATATGKMSVILVYSGAHNIAVIVDELLDTQEIVVKSLGEHLGRIPIYAGATMRADGRVVMLLDLIGISFFESFVALPDHTVDVTQNIPTIMVVDDSLTVRKSAERDIAALGINTILAKDGLDAQEQLANERPNMILLDIEMPRMDGFELLEWVKSQDELKHIPVVMVSSRATDKYVDKATSLGSSAFLGKPYLVEDLVEAFNTFMQLDNKIVSDKG